jgi:ATP-dependent DNA helicase PIF1
MSRSTQIPEIEITCTAKQREFLDAVMAGKSIFLTGKAGTGKSFIVKEAIKRLQQANKKVVAIAPTGIAANNIDGQTIHSMFSLTPYGVLSFETCNFMKDAKRKLLANINTIVIDEISMLRPDVLDGIHWTLKKNGLDGLNTRQVIFVGDLKQLPPILEDNTRTVLYQTYDGDTFDYAKIFPSLNVETIELDEILRQTNADFIDALNVIREGGKHEYFKQFVSKTTAGIILAPHNSTVRMYNDAGLAAQKGDLFVFKADINGEVKPEDFSLEREVQVKIGCKIMYLVNSQDNPLRNGTLGIFVSHNGCHFIRVGNIDYALERVVLTKKQYVYDSKTNSIELKEVGSIEQFPIKLAYALSIHKAQGLTFDEVTIDLTRPCFQKGQMYVALSRVRTPEGLKILVN